MAKSKWKCPKCGSPEVQISLPGWYTETEDFTLTHVECDSEAEIAAWYCGACNDSDSGAPDKVGE